MNGVTPALQTWLDLVRDADADPVFLTYPSALINRLAQPRHFSAQFVGYTKLIQGSPWANTLLLMAACLFTDRIWAGRTGSDFHILRRMVFLLDALTRQVGGVQKLVPDLHLRRQYILNNKFDLPQQAMLEYHADLQRVLQRVEYVMDRLPIRERTGLAQFRVGVRASNLDRPALSHLMELSRSMLPDDLKYLTGTALDPGYLGPAPDRDVLALLCELPLAQADTTNLTTYVYLASANGQDPNQIYTDVDDYCGLAIYLRYNPQSKPIALNTDFLQRINQILYRRHETQHLPATSSLQEYCSVPTHNLPSAYRAETSWASIVTDPGAIDLIDILDILCPLTQLAASKYSSLLTYLRKRSNDRWIAPLALTSATLIVNREHRPNSALQMVGQVHNLLQALPDSCHELNPQILLDTIEIEPVDDKQLRRHQRYGSAYNAAVNAQRTLLANYPQYAAQASAWLLPSLPRPPRRVRDDAIQRANQQERYQRNIDHVAEHWREIHQTADRHYVAFRAVILAFRQATSNSLTHQSWPQALDVTIPGTDVTWQFRIWTQSALHIAVYGTKYPANFENRYLLEYVGSSGEELWCADILRALISDQAQQAFESTWYPLHHIRQAGSPVIRVTDGHLGISSGGSVGIPLNKTSPSPATLIPKECIWGYCMGRSPCVWDVLVVTADMSCFSYA